MTGHDSKEALSIRMYTVHQGYIQCSAIACKICIGALLHTFEPLLSSFLIINGAIYTYFQAMQLMQKPMCMSWLWQRSHMFISASINSLIKSMSSLGVRSGQS